MVKFNFLGKFKAQKDKRERDYEELVRREESAREEFHALKAEHSKIIRESLSEGKRADEQALDELQDRIEAAQRRFSRRQQERALYNTVVDPEITSEDVVQEFNQTFIPAFNKERMHPVMDRLLAAKAEYIEAVMDYFAAEKEFEAERTATRGELSDHYYYKLADIGITTTTQHDHYMINKNVADRIYGGTRPADFNPERKMH